MSATGDQDPMDAGGADAPVTWSVPGLVAAIVADDTGERNGDDRSRREADARLVAALREHGFEGEAYERFADELARYAMSALKSWLLSGRVFALVGRGLVPDDEDLYELRHKADVRNDLASMTVAEALETFRRHALLDGGWSASGGASLKTYFVGAVLLEFPNQFRRYHSDRTRTAWLTPAETLAEVPGPAADDPAVVVAAQDEARRRLDEVPPKVAKALVLASCGFTQAETAAAVDAPSARAVEGMLYRWRKKQCPPTEGGHRAG